MGGLSLRKGGFSGKSDIHVLCAAVCESEPFSISWSQKFCHGWVLEVGKVNSTERASCKASAHADVTINSDEFGDRKFLYTCCCPFDLT